MNRFTATSRALGAMTLCLGLAGCSSMGAIVSAPLKWVGLTGDADLDPAIRAEDLLRHTRTLSSDEFEGRLPGTTGEALTVAYLEEQFRAMGVAPGNPDGSYRQAVTLLGIRSQADAGIQVRGKPQSLKLVEDVSLSSTRAEALVRIRKSPLVFVGYGVQAPEYAWDDYKGMDLRGKTLLMLVNDPPVPDPQNPDELDVHTFKGKAMTYYGRWTYKYDIAARLGAAAALVIHAPGPAGYPWEVVNGAGNREHFTLYRPNGNSDHVPVRGWIRDVKVAELMQAANLDYAALKAAAARPDFRPVTLPAEASFQVRNTVRKLESANVVGRVVGTERPDELIIYTAHWDHLGRDPGRSGDQIFNGARDNATGVAGLLELAHSFAAAPAPVTSLFLAVTAEEQGLLGAAHYVENPLYPLDQTLANINMDGLNIWGRTRDVVIVGVGQNTLEDELAVALALQGRELKPEPSPEKGFYFRSDHFEFARKGVPALFARHGLDYRDRPADYGRTMSAAYIANDYHKVSDEVGPDWDLSGAAEDIQLLEAVGRRVAAAEVRPRWKSGSEFADIRRQRHP